MHGMDEQKCSPIFLKMYKNSKEFPVGSLLIINSWFCKWIIINSNNFWSGIKRERVMLQQFAWQFKICWNEMLFIPWLISVLRYCSIFSRKDLKVYPNAILKDEAKWTLIKFHLPLCFLQLSWYEKTDPIKWKYPSSMFYCAGRPAVLIHCCPLETGNTIFIPIGLITLQLQRPSAWKQISISQKRLDGADRAPHTALSNLHGFFHIEVFKVEPSIKSWRKVFPVISLTL